MIEVIIAIMMGWEKVFKRKKTAQRAMRQAISQVSVMGRRTIARSYVARGNKGDWSSEYKLHSRSKWESQDLFKPIIESAVQNWEGELIAMGCDDTRVKKTGKKIPTAQYGRDPLSPPFQTNLQYGLRYLHASVLMPLHKKYELSARAIPVYFKDAPAIKKPGKKATEEEIKIYRAEKKKQNLSLQTVDMFKQMRKQVDEIGFQDKIIAWALDGSFSNETIFKAELARTILIARTRKDAKLCWPVDGGRRIYSEEKFTPEQVRLDETIASQAAIIFHGGKKRTVSYKEINQILWQRGAGPKQLRLLVVHPTPYRKTKKSRLLYRQPAYLLTTDLNTDATSLLQIYFDRWQLEVAHKELKDNFGLGQAQVRVPASITRQPALTVATYAAMHWAALKAFGPHRPDYWSLPRYQRDKSRVSIQDLIRLFRHEVVNCPEKFPLDLGISASSIFQAASL